MHELALCLEKHRSPSVCSSQIMCNGLKNSRGLTINRSVKHEKELQGHSFTVFCYDCKDE